MAVAHKIKAKPQRRTCQRKTYYATVLVTRAEEWWVEAETAQEARVLLASGEGQRCGLGECVHVELAGAPAPAE